MQSPRFRSIRFCVDPVNQAAWIDQHYFVWRYGISISGLTRLHLADKWWAGQRCTPACRVATGFAARLNPHPCMHYTRSLHSESVQIQRSNRTLGVKCAAPSLVMVYGTGFSAETPPPSLPFRHNQCPFQENLPSQTGHLSVEKRPEFCNAIPVHYTVQASNRKTALVA